MCFCKQQQWQEQKGDLSLPPDEESLPGEDVDELGEDPVWGSLGIVPPIQTLSTQPGKGSSSDAQQQGRGGGSSGYPASGGGGRGRGGGGGRGAGPASQKGMRSGGGIQVGEHTGFLRMRGLPFTANKEDIALFFHEYNPILDTIVLTYRSDGRATGEAYVGFATPDDSQRAMELHRKSMGARYIELFLSNREEHGRALARFANR